ncbi:MAG: orotate phosphoribosyltransferase [Caldilineaceae bacterium]|nr:orotate phosphoribosyltransferase [Caldilineaceae bacterium]
MENNAFSDRAALARTIFQVSNLQGHFRLRSGLTSHEYFDKYLFETDPQLLRAIAIALSPLLPADVDALAGLELGGIPLATALSQVTNLPTLFVRKQAKAYGTGKLAEGGDVAGRKLVIVEDVVTSGGQIRESAHALRALGAHLCGVVAVIDREAGGAANLAQDELPFAALFTMSELKAAASTG